jgi:hypothetical protein
MQVAESQGDFAEIALLSIDSYKVIADELNSSALAVPIQVVMLDYIGFRIHALLKQKEVDWQLISNTVNDAQKNWKQIKGEISDKGLYDAVNTSIKGLSKASRSKNLDMLEFAAQVDLDLVDLLEGFYEKGK